SHPVQPAQHTLVLRLRRPLEGVVRVRMMALWCGKLFRQPVDRRRGLRDDLADSCVGSGLDYLIGAVDQHLERKARLADALGDPDGGLVKYDVDAGHQRTDKL